jgi:glycosyltransferase involved in cell wall biosynthesis
MATSARSLIIPVRNGAQTLPSCLEALKHQLNPADEILVVNDHSTDNSGEIATQSGVRLLHCPPERRGAAAARNVGAEAASNELLVFVDADVIPAPGSLQRLVAPIGATVEASVGYYDAGDRSLGIFSWVKNTSIRVNHRRSGTQITWFWTAFGAVTRTQFQGINGFDEQRFRSATVEDMDFGYRLRQGGARILQVFDAEIQHRHRLSLSSLIGNDFRKSRDWARTLIRHRAAQASDHGATRHSEGMALLCALALWLGLAVASFSWVGAAAAAIGLTGLCALLRQDLILIRREGGILDGIAYVSVRALLYPVAGVGAAYGSVLEWLKK